MKKILILLTTFVMIFCLLGIKINKINAEDNEEIVINYGLIIQEGKIYRSDSISTEIDYNSLGIINNSGGGQESYTFTKSITSTATDKALIDLNTSNLTIVIDGNLTFKQTNNTTPMFYKNPNITIKGNGNVLKIESGMVTIAQGYYTLDNIKLIVEGDFGNDIGTMNEISSLTLTNGAGLKVGNKNSGGCAFTFGSETTPSGVNTMKGSLTYPVTGNLIDAVLDGKTYKDQIGGTNVRYLELNGWKDSKPSPTPVVKDESCEKVIGPTWHWNDEKGVCEGYVTIGTATR